MDETEAAEYAARFAGDSLTRRAGNIGRRE